MGVRDTRDRLRLHRGAQMGPDLGALMAEKRRLG